MLEGFVIEQTARALTEFSANTGLDLVENYRDICI
jgi:hypothetical protein